MSVLIRSDDASTFFRPGGLRLMNLGLPALRSLARVGLQGASVRALRCSDWRECLTARLQGSTGNPYIVVEMGTGNPYIQLNAYCRRDADVPEAGSGAQ
jgi:hypothetical protein